MADLTPARAFVDAHLGLVVSFLVIALTVTRLYVVSGTSFQTMGALISVGGQLPLLFPILVQLLIVFLLFLPLPVFVIARLLGAPRGFAFVFAIVGLAPAFMTAPAWLFAANVVGLVFLTIAIRRHRHRGRRARESDDDDKTGDAHRSIKRAVLRTAVLLASVVVGWVAIDRTPWLPAEQLKMEDSTQSFVGYEVRADPNSVIFLREADRALVRISAGDIESRSYCAIQGDRSSLWVILAYDRPTYPSCG